MSPEVLGRRARLWLPPVAMMATIYAFSAQSDPMPEVTAHVWDKLLHTAEYGGLALLFARALSGDGWGMPATLVIALLLASAYGATDEYHQSFVPNRCSDAEDWVADTLGAAVGCVTYAGGSRLRAERALRRARTSHPDGQTSRTQ